MNKLVARDGQRGGKRDSLLTRPLRIVRNPRTVCLTGIAVCDLVTAAHRVIEGNAGAIPFFLFYAVFLATPKQTAEQEKEKPTFFHINSFWFRNPKLL